MNEGRDRECEFCRWRNVDTKAHDSGIPGRHKMNLCGLCMSAITEGTIFGLGVGYDDHHRREISRTILYAAHWVAEQIKGKN